MHALRQNCFSTAVVLIRRSVGAVAARVPLSRPIEWSPLSSRPALDPRRGRRGVRRALRRSG